MELLQKTIVRVGFISILALALYIHFLLPRYPKINDEQSYEILLQQIIISIEQNVNSVNFDFMGNQKQLETHKNELIKLQGNIQECDKNREKTCLISAYEDFMDDNIAPSDRIQYRVQYVHNKYGKFGDYVLTENFGKLLY